jgi:hypothetical protein
VIKTHRPKGREAFTDIGEHFTDVGEHFTDIGEHFTDVGEHFTDVGEHFTDVGKTDIEPCGAGALHDKIYHPTYVVWILTAHNSAGEQYGKNRI